MDIEVALLIGAAVVGIVVGVLHLVGYVPPRYRRMLREVQAATADAIGTRIEAVLARFGGADVSESVLDPNVALAPLTARLDALPHAIGEELRKVALETAFTPPDALPPQVTGAIGGTVASSNRKMAELRGAIGQGLLGPYGALLQQFAPPLYEYLVENPEMVVQALEMPVIQKLIQRAAGALGGLRGGEVGSTELTGRITR